MGYEGVIFIKNTFVNIFDFVNESQSLIRKVSSVKKVIESVKFPQLHEGFIAQLHEGFIASSELCQNLRSLR